MVENHVTAAQTREVFDDLVRFETILWTRIDAALQKDAGLSLGSLNALIVIDSTADCRVQDLARAVAITIGGASQTVDRLESAGWCLRRANPSDRRSSIIELTTSGAEVLSAASPLFDEELARFLRTPLNRDAFEQMRKALRQLRTAAAQLAEESD